MAKKEPESTSAPSPAAVAKALAASDRPRFTIKPKEGGKLPTHAHVQVIDGVGYTHDAITAHALKGTGCSVIDGLTGEEYTGKKPKPTK